MTAFDDAIEDLHADTDLSALADYRQGGQGPATRLRVMHTVLEPSRAPFGMTLQARADQVTVRLADAPHIGPNDSFTFDPDGSPWVGVVTSAPERDAENLSATCRIRRM